MLSDDEGGRGWFRVERCSGGAARGPNGLRRMLALAGQRGRMRSSRLVPLRWQGGCLGLRDEGGHVVDDAELDDLLGGAARHGL